MRIGVPKEPVDGEKRVALIPDTVASLAGKRLAVVVEAGAGEQAGHPDPEYAEAGAEIGTADDVYGADLVLRVATPSVAEIGGIAGGKVLVGFLAPLTSGETTRALAEGGVTGFAIESIPRITRAQAMDGLSSQANVAGYAAALLAARECGRFFPMMTTAAGTVSPARVMVLGAGVAGLQAIATAKRLGAVVSGFDIRRAAWEQIASLGGRPLELDFIPDAEDEGGYARPLTEEENEQVREALAENAAKQDVIITTAADPGPPGADPDHRRGGSQHGAGLGDRRSCRRDGRQLRADRGRGDRRVERASRSSRPRNLPSDMAAHASQLYAEEPREPARPDHRRGGAEPRLRRRDRRRRLHHPRRRDRNERGRGAPRAGDAEPIGGGRGMSDGPRRPS